MTNMDELLKATLKENDLLNFLNQWKALPFQSLWQNYCPNHRYNTFLKKIHRLEKAKALSSTTFGQCNIKYVYIRPEASRLIDPDSPVAITKEHILHDALTSNITLSLSKHSPFFNPKLEHQLINQRNWDFSNILDPDATFTSENARIALELELTPKSRGNLYPKLEHYARSSYFNCVIYTFVHGSHVERFKIRLKEMKKKFKDDQILETFDKKFFLLHIENPSDSFIDFEKCHLFVNGETRDFSRVFGVVKSGLPGRREAESRP